MICFPPWYAVSSVAVPSLKTQVCTLNTVNLIRTLAVLFFTFIVSCVFGDVPLASATSTMFSVVPRVHVNGSNLFVCLFVCFAYSFCIARSKSGRTMQHRRCRRDSPNPTEYLFFSCGGVPSIWSSRVPGMPGHMNYAVVSRGCWIPRKTSREAPS